MKHEHVASSYEETGRYGTYHSQFASEIFGNVSWGNSLPSTIRFIPCLFPQQTSSKSIPFVKYCDDSLTIMNYFYHVKLSVFQYVPHNFPIFSPNFPHFPPFSSDFLLPSGKLRASRSSKRASGKMPGPGGPKVAVRHGQRVAWRRVLGVFGREMWRKTYSSLMSQWPTCIVFFFGLHLLYNKYIVIRKNTGLFHGPLAEWS